jgi:two-component system, cell cycle sensor histidine kinase and response regulator CckA
MMPGMGSRLLSFKRAMKNGRHAKRIRVLVVDDDENMRMFVDRVLCDGGYETQTAEDGDDAIAIAATTEPFDLLVTDEMMPRMVGHQLARYMRERYLDIKVLYLSGFREELFKAKGSLWADEAFVDKPCTPDELLRAVSQLLFGEVRGDGSPETKQS